MDQNKLEKILEQHKIWIETGKKGGDQANLSKMLLQGANLEGALLLGANLRLVDLDRANLNKADLRHADLSYSALTHTNLQEANLSEADLHNADLTYANLRGANLSETNLASSLLHGTNLDGAKLYGTNLKYARLPEISLKGAELIRVKNIESAEIYDDAKLHEIKIDRSTFYKLPRELISKYKESSFILGGIEDHTYGEKIIRSIEFPPEYHQAGISILNYFGTVLRKKYPDQTANVKIEQDGIKVTMTIDPIEGESEIIEHALNEYGLVIMGQMLPEEFTNDRLLVLELKNELRMAQARVESQKEIIGYQRADMNELRRLVDTALRNPAPIAVQTTATSSLQSDIKLNIEIAPQISLIQGGLNELKEQLPAGSEEAKTVQDFQDSLKEINNEESPEKVAESSAMSKFQRFLENVDKAETTAGKIIKKTKDGIDIARKLAGHYNEIAQWCGLPTVPKPFTK